MIHWQWVVFSAVVILLLYGIFRDKDTGGSYGFDLETPLCAILLIAYVLVWGGIFWW